MDSQILHKLRERYEDAIKEIAGKGAFTAQDLEYSYKLICGLEKLEKLMGGYDHENYSFRSYGRSYDNRSQGSYNNRSYSPDNGYSTHSPQEKMRMKLEDMLSEANTDEERRMVHQWMRQMEG